MLLPLLLASLPGPGSAKSLFEESGEFPSDVEFVELETDVGWYGRQCRKRIRDQVRFFGINHIYTGH